LAQHIILGSDVLDYIIKLFIALCKHYIYCCRFSVQKLCVSSFNIFKTNWSSVCLFLQHPCNL